MRVVLVVALLLALVAAAMGHQGDFETALAAEAPELVEKASDSFMTLSEMGESGAPETSFAQLAQSTLAAHARTEIEPSLMEASSQSYPAVPANPVAANPLTPSDPWHRGDNVQPVGRHNAEITCLDGDCTRATKVRSAAVGTHPNQGTPEPPTKLDIALSAVKEEIMVRAKELHLEKEWSKKVANLIDEYQQKLTKVTNNIAHLRAQTKALLRKKKQIQNVQVQNKLRYKLQLAQADLNRLQKQMEHIAGKENEFTDTEKELKGTMQALKNSLLKLRGQEVKKLAREGI